MKRPIDIKAYVHNNEQLASEFVDPYINKFKDWKNHPCYYITAIDGGLVYRMAGPFKTHKEALDLVSETKNFCIEKDARAHFMSWGTAKFKKGWKGSWLGKDEI